jgi:hypothetical protein
MQRVEPYKNTSVSARNKHQSEWIEQNIKQDFDNKVRHRRTSRFYFMLHALSLFSYLNVTSHASYPYKTKGKIMLQLMLIHSKNNYSGRQVWDFQACDNDDDVLLGFGISPEDGDSMFLRNLDNYVRVHTAQKLEKEKNIYWKLNASFILWRNTFNSRTVQKNCASKQRHFSVEVKSLQDLWWGSGTRTGRRLRNRTLWDTRQCCIQEDARHNLSKHVFLHQLVR